MRRTFLSWLDSVAIGWIVGRVARYHCSHCVTEAHYYLRNMMNGQRPEMPSEHSDMGGIK